MCAVEQLKGVISFRVDMIYDDKYYDVQKKIIDLVESGMDDYDAFDAADFSKCESQLIITTDSCDADAASDVISRIISDIHTQLPPAINYSFVPFKSFGLYVLPSPLPTRRLICPLTHQFVSYVWNVFRHNNN